MFQKILNLHIYFCQKAKKNSVDGKKNPDLLYFRQIRILFGLFPYFSNFFIKVTFSRFLITQLRVKRQWNLTDKSIDRHLLQSCIKARKECFLRYFSQMMFLPLNWTSTFIVQTWHDVLVFFFQCIFNA